MDVGMRIAALAVVFPAICLHEVSCTSVAVMLLWARVRDSDKNLGCPTASASVLRWVLLSFMGVGWWLPLHSLGVHNANLHA